jgi:hypothetical protein
MVVLDLSKICTCNSTLQYYKLSPLCHSLVTDSSRYSCPLIVVSLGEALPLVHAPGLMVRSCELGPTFFLPACLTHSLTHSLT